MLALGIPGDDGGAYGAYVALLRRRIQEALTYPSAARRRGMSGTVHLDIAIEPTGRIGDVRVVRSSSHELLDAAALEAVRALRQVPFPPGVRPRPVRVRLPVVFELR
jgi:protein TonB